MQFSDIPFTRLYPASSLRGWLKPYGNKQTFLLAGTIFWAVTSQNLPCLAQYDIHDNAWEHNRRGEWQLQRRNYVGALQEFQASLSLRPAKTQEAAFQNNLGMAYLGLASYGYKTQGLAIDAFQAACRLAPTYALYRQNLVRAHAQAGQLEEFERELLRIVVENPQDAEGWFLLGLIYRMQHDPERAKPSFENYLKLQPYSEMARAAQQLLLEKSGEEGGGGEHGKEGSESGKKEGETARPEGHKSEKMQSEEKSKATGTTDAPKAEKPARPSVDKRLEELNAKRKSADNEKDEADKKSAENKVTNKANSGQSKNQTKPTPSKPVKPGQASKKEAQKPKPRVLSEFPTQREFLPQYAPAPDKNLNLKPIPRKENLPAQKEEPVRMRLSPPPGLNPGPESAEEAKPDLAKHENPSKTQGSSKAELKTPAGLEPKTGLNRKPEVRQLSTPSKTESAETGRE